jgi:hypothetical protein
MSCKSEATDKLKNASYDEQYVWTGSAQNEQGTRRAEGDHGGPGGGGILIDGGDQPTNNYEAGNRGQAGNKAGNKGQSAHMCRL